MNNPLILFRAIDCMTKKYPLLIGMYESQTITGVAIAFQILISELEKQNMPFRKVNIGERQKREKIGSFSSRRGFETLRAIIKSWIIIPSSNVIYITVGVSLLGFLRDAFILLPAILLRKKTIIHVNSGGYKGFYNKQSFISKKIIRAIISKVTIIILLSDLLKDQFYFINDDSKFRVVPNTVDPSLLDNNSISKKPGKDEAIKLLYLSNLIVDKGYLEVLEACRILKERNNVQFQCYFCGDFISTTSNIEQLTTNTKQQKDIFFGKIGNYHLDHQISYLGVVSGTEKKKVLQDSHLFILPTHYPWEGQPLSIFEAMAYGLPVISTDYRAMPDQVQDGVTGYLLKTHDPAEIAARVEELWLNPEKYEEMSRQAIKKFWNEFSPEQHMQKMIQILYGD